jgi:RNA polymerase sigma-70 factor (ECF subfamily)
VPWLQPYPDVLLDDLPDPAPGPEARYASVEAISLAFVTALQVLPPNQRAVLLLRDVLGYRASETAELLGLTVDAVTSALRRARATIEASAGAQEATPSAPDGTDERYLLDRFVTAFSEGDVADLVALFTEDVWLRMPPLPFEYRGKAAAQQFLAAVAQHRRSVARMVPVRANRQPGWGEYVPDPATGLLHLVGVLVVAVSGDRIRELTRFESSLGPSLGLPRTLGALHD